jgi:hypothetical protein
MCSPVPRANSAGGRAAWGRCSLRTELTSCIPYALCCARRVCAYRPSSELSDGSLSNDNDRGSPAICACTRARTQPRPHTHTHKHARAHAHAQAAHARVFDAATAHASRCVRSRAASRAGAEVARWFRTARLPGSAATAQGRRRHRRQRRGSTRWGTSPAPRCVHADTHSHTSDVIAPRCALQAERHVS